VCVTVCVCACDCLCLRFLCGDTKFELLSPYRELYSENFGKKFSHRIATIVSTSLSAVGSLSINIQFDQQSEPHSYSLCTCQRAGQNKKAITQCEVIGSLITDD
jgi:hypothetical protein